LFSTEEKFNYFLKIEKQVNTIIRLNYKSPKDDIINKIIQLLNTQNSKVDLRLELDMDEYDDGRGPLILYLSEFTQKTFPPAYSKKRTFKTYIHLQSIIREIRFSIILDKKMDK